MLPRSQHVHRQSLSRRNSVSSYHLFCCKGTNKREQSKRKACFSFVSSLLSSRLLHTFASFAAYFWFVCCVQTASCLIETEELPVPPQGAASSSPSNCLLLNHFVDFFRFYPTPTPKSLKTLINTKDSHF